MDLDDLTPEPEAGIAVAALAVLVLAPWPRRLMRRGAVAVLAGLLTAGRGLARRAPGTDEGVRPAESMDAPFVHELVREARGELARRRRQPA